MTPLIECKDVCVNYGTFEACKNVSFSVNAGDYVCIVGTNGSGKTTLVKAILGLIPIKSGKISLDRLHTGYLPQQKTIQKDFPASVKEVVLSGCVSSSSFFHTKQDKQNAEFQIQRLQLNSIANKAFSSLSGGQQQRVLLARALCAAKNLLVLDEPVTGLDPIVTDELYTIIQELNKKDGLAILMVSHDVHRAIQNATHILQMNTSPLFFGKSQDYAKSDLYKSMSHVEVCETHLIGKQQIFNRCGADCNASHIHITGTYKND